MATPLTDTEKDEIARLLSEGLSYAEIGRRTGRGRGSIARIAESIGHRAGQSNLTRAHEARSAFCAERRAAAAAKAQERVDELLKGFTAARPVVARDGDGSATVLMVDPDWKGLADMAKAVNLLQRTVLDIDRHDRQGDEGLSDVKAWLAGMLGREP